MRYFGPHGTFFFLETLQIIKLEHLMDLNIIVEFSSRGGAREAPSAARLYLLIPEERLFSSARMGCSFPYNCPLFLF